MFKAFINIFRVPEVRNKVLFTLLMLAIYRIGFSVPLPGVDQDHFASVMQTGGDDDSAAARLTNYIAIFSGGNIGQATIFGLGVMPYISAAIIFQLLSTVVPALEKLKKEGESGQRKIQEWTRYATVVLAAVQSAFWMGMLSGQGAIQSTWTNEYPTAFWLMGVACLTAGCVFLMWLGEQIDEYGLGNGISLIIMAGILSQMPGAIAMVVQNFDASQSAMGTAIGTGDVAFLLICFVCVTGLAIFITQAQRRIPIQQAKHTRGRRVYGGQKQYLPLRLNHGGVMPIIFAQSLMLFPGMILGSIASWMQNQQMEGTFAGFINGLNIYFAPGQFLYVMLEVVLIYFFAYFWVSVQFQPKEIANNLRDYGSFIPGMRPGPRTAEYLEKVMLRVTYVGAAFLCLIAVVPITISASLGIPYMVTSFLGGTGLLIVISVALDMVQRIEANLMMRNYGGFLGGEGNPGKRVRGRNY